MLWAWHCLFRSYIRQRAADRLHQVCGAQTTRTAVFSCILRSFILPIILAAHLARTRLPALRRRIHFAVAPGDSLGQLDTLLSKVFEVVPDGSAPNTSSYMPSSALMTCVLSVKTDASETDLRDCRYSPASPRSADPQIRRSGHMNSLLFFTTSSRMMLDVPHVLHGEGSPSWRRPGWMFYTTDRNAGTCPDPQIRRCPLPGPPLRNI